MNVPSQEGREVRVPDTLVERAASALVDAEEQWREGDWAAFLAKRVLAALHDEGLIHWTSEEEVLASAHQDGRVIYREELEQVGVMCESTGEYCEAAPTEHELAAYYAETGELDDDVWEPVYRLAAQGSQEPEPSD